MLYESRSMEEMAVLNAAAGMCAAARTAPKTRGKDTIHTLVLTGDEKEALARKMEEIGAREAGLNGWYSRDASNVRKAQAVVLIGAERTYRGVSRCGFCGFADYAACKAAGGNCAFVYTDLGIAVASAVKTAAIENVDNRIMFSVGKAAGEMNYAETVCWLGIPLSVSGKSIFFDR